MPYRDGRPSGGRPKGRLNDATIRVRAFCRSICEDAEYQEQILERARTNTLGSMEAVVWGYAYGKPKESLDVHVGRMDGREDLSQLSDEELTQRVESLAQRLRDARTLQLEISSLPIEITVPEGRP